MRITVELSTDEAIALRRFAAANEMMPLEHAAALALREYLIGAGYLELPYELDEDTETQGDA